MLYKCSLRYELLLFHYCSLILQMHSGFYQLLKKDVIYLNSLVLKYCQKLKMCELLCRISIFLN